MVAAEQDDLTPKVGRRGVAPRKPLNQKDFDGENIEYQGSATVRRISAAEWSNAGALGQAATEWNKANHYKVPARQFSKEAVSVLKQDGSFLVPE